MKLSRFEIIVGILATLSTGLWTYYIFLAERTHEPKYKLEFQVHCANYDDTSLIISNKFKIINTGKVLVELGYVETRIKQLAPKFSQLHVGIDEFNILSSDDNRLLWPKIGQREWFGVGRSLFVEPGETMELDSDFLVLNSAKVLRLYGFVSKSSKEKTGRSQKHTFKVSEECK